MSDERRKCNCQPAWPCDCCQQKRYDLCPVHGRKARRAATVAK